MRARFASCLRLGAAVALCSFAPIAVSATHEAEDKAAKLFERLTGVPLPKNDPRYKQMVDFIKGGRMTEAAKIATEDPAFVTVTARNMAAQMATRDESPVGELDDFQATVMGLAKDNGDIRNLLNGNFLYEGSFSGLPAYSVANNDHYIQLEQRDPYQLRKRQITSVPDVAGVLTSRSWAKSHYDAGTNRRAVEYTYKVFLCRAIDVWKDTGLDDFRVRRDVERTPGGDPAEYQRRCRTCHAGMDAQAGAFAKFDFQNNALVYYSSGTAPKYNINTDHYPEGYVTYDDSWLNLSTQHHNASIGWRGKLNGKGLNQFANMIADSRGFSECMVRRMFKEVCRKDIQALDPDELSRLTSDLEDSGYKVRDAFMDVALSPRCLE